MLQRDQYEIEILAAKRVAEQAKEEQAALNSELTAAHAALETQKQELQVRNKDLESLRASLEERVRARTSELAEVVLELQEFNYTIAHNFRAPLRSILSTSYMLIEEEAQALSERALMLLQRQQGNGRKLSTLVDDLLQYSRLGAQPLVLQSIDLSSLAQKTLEATLLSQGRTDIQGNIQAGIIGVGDVAMISLAVHNLVENAIKFSPSGGSIGFGANEDGPELVCFVSDQGIGIEKAYLQSVLKPFERLHRDEAYPGNGIGLAIVERVMRRHGGRVWVESEPGRGSTFYFSLPTSPIPS
jgi:signal transduction histidine kinase